jgi:rod shape determining protein RodA
MNYLLNHIKRLDWKLLLLSIALCCIGLITICSISIGKQDFSNLKKQIIFFVAGMVLMLVLSLIDWRGFKENPYLILTLYFICIALLAGLLLFGTQTRGIKGWYHLGFFSFDPIGVMIIVLIILLSKFFSKRHIEMYKLRHIALSGFYVLLPFALIAKQPNLGSALMLIAIWIGVLIVSGIKLRQFFLLIMCGLVMFGIGCHFY